MDKEKIHIKDKLLAKLVENWFFRTAHKEKAFSRNSVGKVIKTKLKMMGHWRNSYK